MHLLMKNLLIQLASSSPSARMLNSTAYARWCLLKDGTHLSVSTLLPIFQLEDKKYIGYNRARDSAKVGSIVGKSTKLWHWKLSRNGLHG